MHRRSVLAIAATIPLAGCGALGFGDGVYLDDEIEAGNVYSFDADGGDVEITIEVTDAGEIEGDDGEAIDMDSTSVVIRYDGSPVFNEVVDEGSEETFEETLDGDGEHEIQLVSGVADVSIEEV